MRTEVSGVRWPWVVTAGVAAAALTFSLVRPAVYLYVYGPVFFGGEARGVDEARLFGEAMGAWGTPALHVLLTTLAAFWVARRAGDAPVTHGVLVGLTSAVCNQLIVLALYPPVLSTEVTQYLGLGLAGGLLGGAAARRGLAWQEALYRASCVIGRARDPLEVAAAIGKNLASGDVRRVTVWTTVQDAGDCFASFDRPAAWAPGSVRVEPLGERLDASGVPALRELREGAPLLLRARDLPDVERVAWREAGVRSVLLVPLDAPGGGPGGGPGGRRVGLLAVASKNGRFSRPAARAYLTAGAQAALAVENLRLIEGAREASTLRERQRMAREIHDTLAQGFTSIVMNVQAAEGAFPGEPAALRRHHAQIARTAREGLDAARRLVWALRPEPLEESSLSDALGSLARRWSEVSAIAATTEITGTPLPLPDEVEVALLRVAQEALSNARKHSGARRIALTLSYLGGSVALDARDDGVGFVPQASVVRESGGFGLRGMRERVHELGGTLSIESAPGEGTALVAEMPVNARNDDGDQEAR